MKLLVKRDFYKYLNPVKITEYCLWASTYIIADKFDIPLIIQGDSPVTVLGTRLTSRVDTDYDAMKADELQTLSSGWKEYVGVDGIEEKDVYLFHYKRKKLEERGCRAIWLNYFLKEWTPHNNAVFSKEHGLRWRPENFDWE